MHGRPCSLQGTDSDGNSVVCEFSTKDHQDTPHFLYCIINSNQIFFVIILGFSCEVIPNFHNH